MILSKGFAKNFSQIASNWGLFVILSITIFILPILSTVIPYRLFEVFLSLIVLLSVYATREDRKKRAMVQLGIAILAIWVTRVIDMEGLNFLAKTLLILFFMVRVFKFILAVSRKSDVNSLVIVEAINGYLLMGIGFGVLFSLVLAVFPGSFNFTVSVTGNDYFDPIYYAFVSMTTLGYGDLLPLNPFAKSMALLVTLCGQFYLVTVMAFLIGKLLTQKHEKA